MYAWRQNSAFALRLVDFLSLYYTYTLKVAFAADIMEISLAQMFLKLNCLFF